MYSKLKTDITESFNDRFNMLEKNFEEIKNSISSLNTNINNSNNNNNINNNINSNNNNINNNNDNNPAFNSLNAQIIPSDNIVFNERIEYQYQKK